MQNQPNPQDMDLAFQIEQDRQARRIGEIALWRGPSVDLHNISEQSATDLAKSVIQTGLILNGGAVVALPAVGAIFGDGINGIAIPILLAGLLFVFGLMVSWATAIVAYFAICIRQNYHDYQIHQNTKHIEAKFSDAEDAYNEKIGERSKLIELGRNENAKYGRYRKIGIVLCFASFLLFATGAIVSGWALLSKAGEAPAAYAPLQRR